MNGPWHSHKGVINWNKFWWDPRSMVSYKFWYDWDVSESWRMASSQYNYFSNEANGYINGDVININSKDEIQNVANNMGVQEGDLLYFMGKEAENPHHAAIISKIENGEIYYAAHTKSRREQPLSESIGNEKVLIIRIKDDAK
jgi:hypothetical protein